jgi:hypothetical protein
MHEARSLRAIGVPLAKPSIALARAGATSGAAIRRARGIPSGLARLVVDLRADLAEGVVVDRHLVEVRVHEAVADAE